ncbi:serine/threonine-protein kinase mTOR-like [Oscarella lobularis]|uniref:serine/threonine-protein kinase mTOR-like n=1 Tax=Oscarella lobularis TaxID=121494 RepID=UPI003313CE87
MLQSFVSGLKSRHDDVREKTAKQMQQYIETDLREVSADENASFVSDLYHSIFEMVSSSELHEKKGGVMAIMAIVGIDDGSSSRIRRFEHYLRSVLPCNDAAAMEMAAKAVGRITLSGGTFTAEYVEYEVKRCLEWLQGDRTDGRRHAAVLLLRELAVSAPTLFYQKVQPFFDNIFTAVRDPKQVIREGAAAALRACLVLTSQRETKESQAPYFRKSWYQQVYEEAERGLVDQSKDKGSLLTRDDRAHGSLLIINELIVNSKLREQFCEWDVDEIANLQQKPHLKVLEELGNPKHLDHVHHRPSAGVGGSTGGLGDVKHDHSQLCKEFMISRFDEVCRLVLKLQSSRSPIVQQSLLALLPRLAVFHSESFVRNYLADTMNYLLACLRKDRDKSNAFRAVGLMAIAVSDDIINHMDPILNVIKSTLSGTKDSSLRKSKPVTVDQSVFGCISMLARALEDKLVDEMKALLDPMLAVGLSQPLTVALKTLANDIPSLRREIQAGLLLMLSEVLLTSPPRYPSLSRSTSGSSTSAAASSHDSTDASTLTLAMRTLCSFSFNSHTLTQFVRRCADIFLTSTHKEVRLEAVKTCCHLLVPALKLQLSNQGIPVVNGTVSHTHAKTVSEVLSKLLYVCVTDEEEEIRLCVLTNLDSRFDGHLAQAENLSTLFICLNDELFSVRELAICTIGRLSALNPAYVMPSLRKMLIQFLTELEFSGVGRNKEQAAKLLGHLIANAPKLTRPYMQPILKALIPKLKENDSNPGVVTSVLAAVGELAHVCGHSMRPFVNDLFPVMIEILQDSASLQKRDVSLWVMSQIVENTGYVVKPYKKYPNLLDVLISVIKTEQQPSARREAIRLLGLLGALDPYKYKLHMGMRPNPGTSEQATSQSSSEKTKDEMGDTMSEMLINMPGASLEDFYSAVAISALMKILKDVNLSDQHTFVIQAVTFIFKSLGMKCVQFLPQIMPPLLNSTETLLSKDFEFLFQQLGVLISLVKHHSLPYMDEIFKVINKFWEVNSPMQNSIILVVEQLALALGGDFKIYLPKIIPQILLVCMQDTSPDRLTTLKLLNAIQTFRSNLDDYLHLILPPIVKLFESRDVPMAVRRAALLTIGILTTSVDFRDFASRLIHPIVRTLDHTPDLRSTCMETLSLLVQQLGKKFDIFHTVVSKTLQKHHIQHHRFEGLVARVLSKEPLVNGDNDVESPRKTTQRSDETSAIESYAMKKLHANIVSLQKAWVTSSRVSKDDWTEWLRRFSVELLKESPSPALRSCYTLGGSYNPLAKSLFYAAFVSCWAELPEQQQDELVRSLEQALRSQNIPEITQALLGLAEFMEHCDRGPLPLDSQLLGGCAFRCRAYAKALHYKEDEFHKGPTIDTLESLIEINNKLQQSEAAAGVLNFAVKYHRNEMRMEESWYEKLHDWDQALDVYEKKMMTNPEKIELAMGKMRCLEALGEWDQLYFLAKDRWAGAKPEMRRQMARMSAASAWGLGQWDDMDEYVCFIPRDTLEGAFYRAVMALHQDHFVLAQKCIDAARDVLDTELTAMVGESYSRAYGAMVSVQLLSELEEIVQYKKCPDRREGIKKTWWERLQGCQVNVEDWQRILQVRSLVVEPHEDRRTWIKYASLCRRNGRLNLSQKTLIMLLGSDPSKHPDQRIPIEHPHVAFAYMKHMWNSDEQRSALNQLQNFVEKSLHPQTRSVLKVDNSPQKDDMHSLLARCYLKLGEWNLALNQTDTKTLDDSTIKKVLGYYSSATEYDKNWYKAWHRWAVMNFQAVLHYKNQLADEEAVSGTSPATSSSPPAESVSLSTSSANIHLYTKPAVQGFFRSIALSKGSSLQDTLRLLTLWFDYGHQQDVYEALIEGIKTIQIDVWLQVIPQLIARIDTPRQLIGRQIHQLLMDIGKCHPQALIYPLTVAAKSASQSRCAAANHILQNMCEHSNTLVQQARLVSEELIRVAILWHEQWHEGLEEASRLFFGERKVEGMFAVLEPLHSMMERGPQTLKESSFQQAYGRDLAEAHEWCKKYKRSQNLKDLNQAWDLYYTVFRRISKQLPQLTSLELQYVSPQLLKCCDLEAAVPGSYEPNQPIIRIQKCSSALQVITSKQRPRKLTITGSNGKDFTFLLKGHEDLRQDERVMQLFGLVNTLLSNNPITFKRHLGIQRYSVIPLSTNSGLIGWVPHCDTLHALIRDYREKCKILLNVEHRSMLKMSPDYDHLTLMQKVEVFENALKTTPGDDLAKLLWLKSPSSEVWFDRRTNYTRSLAVMSMVGYVLGLGDRHPSNLMLDRLTGHIVHIDFGDCFEVAMTREKFPEKIPFRLTRMLVKAMEVTGIEGNFRMTCHHVMTVLRENKESLMAVLEAFVYDPLLNWRLVDAAPKGKREKDSPPSRQSDSGDMLGESEEQAVPSSRKPVASGDHAVGADDGSLKTEVLNKKALKIISRVQDKLTGRDFSPDEWNTVQEQVDQLIRQAQSNENLCQCYIGWCPFW